MSITHKQLMEEIHRPGPPLIEAPAKPVLPVLRLVGCCAMKLQQAAPARDLYCSQLFRLIASHISHGPWAILSAKHGLVWPDEVIEPYNMCLDSLSPQGRREWAIEIKHRLPEAERYEIWAGELYAKDLGEWLRADRPLRGMGIGKQLKLLRSGALMPTTGGTAQMSLGFK